MYKAYGSHWENLSEEGQDSLSSSFWTDHESEEEQRECFVTQDCRDVRTKGKPGISEQEIDEKRESFVQTNKGDAEKILKDKDESGEESQNCSTGTNSGKVSEEDEEGKSFEREDDTDNSGESRIDQGSDSNTEPSESEDEQESEEEEDECLVKLGSAENPERKSWEAQNREKVTDEEEFVNDEQISKSWASDEVETGDENLLGKGNESDDEEVERFGSCLDRRVGDYSDCDGLQNERETEYSTSEANSGVTGERIRREELASEEERSPCFVNQDDLDRLVLHPSSPGSAQKRETVLETVGSNVLNKYHNFSNVEQTWLDEQKNVERRQLCETLEPNQYIATSVRGDEWIKGEDGLYIKQKETNGPGVPERKTEYSVEQHENNQRKEDDYDMRDEKEADDYRGSTGSPTVSILTSGYGTYRPDSPRDELDYRDDCTLTGLDDDSEYHGMVDCENDDCQSVDERGSLLEASEQQIPSLSLDASKEATLQNAGDCQDEPAENRPGSLGGPNERDQEFDFTAESVKQEGGHDLPKGGDFGDAGTVYQDYRHPFNLRQKSRAVFEHRNEHGRVGEETRKQKKAKSHGLKSEPISVLEERLEQLRVSAGVGRGDLVSESEETCSDSDGHSSATAELPSAFEAYMKGMKRSHSESDIRPQPKSFIRPVMDHPHTRNLKKTDPVAKYFQYKQDWEMFKASGEKSRKELHWAIREQLMYQPPPPKPQRTYVPNTYVVPTEKKRSALRWEIRHDLANGIIPAKITYT